MDRSPGEHVGSLLPSGGNITPKGRKRGPVLYIAVGGKHDHRCAMGQEGWSEAQRGDIAGKSANPHALTRDLGQHLVN